MNKLQYVVIFNFGSRLNIDVVAVLVLKVGA